MSNQDIAYSAIIEQKSIIGEVTNPTKLLSPSKKSHSRDLAISIASQAKSGESACVHSQRDTVYFAKSNEYTIVVLAPAKASVRVVLTFMRIVQDKLKSKNLPRCPQHTQEILEKALKDVEQHQDQINAAKSNIEDVRRIMVENVDEILQRNERLGLLVDRTSQMSQSANIFNRQTAQLESKMRLSKFKVIIIAAIGLTGLGGLLFKLL